MRAQKILNRINELGSISEQQNCLARTFGTPAFIKGSKKVFEWMYKAGLQTSIDNLRNVRGKLLSENPNAKTFVIASHIDTVINAGKFDGPLGVLLGLDIIEHIIEKEQKLPFNIELIAFSDEEGCRFHTTYLGSKVVAGNFDKKILNKKDVNGISLQDAIEAVGGNINKLSDDAIAAENWLGYFEIHIEQGPVLYDKNIPVGIVTAIAGQRRAEIIFEGVAGHAGTVPMNMRHDALCAASEFILGVEDFAMEKKDKIVATVGKLDITHSASNVIPGKVICSLDLRSADDTILATAYTIIKELCESIADRRRVKMEWTSVQQTKPTICDEKMNAILKNSISNAGFNVVEMVSGAGHDGVAIAPVSPIAMLFVRCFEGISHNPLENVEIKDIEGAIKVSDNFINQLITLHS